MCPKTHISTMKHNNLIAGILNFFILISVCNSVRAQEKTDDFSLRKLFGLSSEKDDIHINQYVKLNELSEWAQESERFYRNREYRPVWFDNGKMNQKGKELTQELKQSWEEGLPEPIVYLAKVEKIEVNMRKRSAEIHSFAQMFSKADVYLTQAYFDYASKISTGILNPEDLNIVWEILPKPVNLVSHLEKALESKNIAESFDDLKPKHEQYDLLLKAFHDLMAVKNNGGWQLPGSFPPLKEYDSHQNVVRIKEYLQSTGDLKNSDSIYIHSPYFDDKLNRSVKIFQQRHGLKQDGIVGEATLKQMNVPLQYRLDQLRINIDRIRWWPRDFGADYIVVNIPDYSFTFYKSGHPVQEMKVVVGKNENYTPVLEDTLYSIVFNPSWNVPNSIATEELFPKMLNDTTFMERNNYSILRKSYVSEDTINIKEYDWSKVSRDSFPFFIVQLPGAYNSLGQIQFMLQNQYSIFMHDTPADYLFDIAQRDFSHGCIRLEKPKQLAMILLNEQLPSDTLLNYFADEKKRVVNLKKKIPVHIMYQTAWIEANEINFREDVYEFDKISMAFFRRNFPELAWSKPATK